jgi:hypothetical protein
MVIYREAFFVLRRREPNGSERPMTTSTPTLAGRAGDDMSAAIRG